MHSLPRVRDNSAMNIQMPDLPVTQVLPQLCQTLTARNCALLCAPPGSGKTTLTPLALLDAAWLQGRRIVMLQPRRVAARAAASYMARLLHEPVGETVGYQIRHERKRTAATRIEVITEGVLTRRLQADPELAEVGLIIFDEFHERSLDADLALALARDAQKNLRENLRILIMSATLDATAVAQLLDAAPVIEASGRQYPVAVSYQGQPQAAQLPVAVARSIGQALREQPGDVLAFLPGAAEIHAAQRALLHSLPADTDIHLLYGALSSAAQDAALQPAAHGRRKVILATNIAQTSLTVEGVCAVVDAGLEKVVRFERGAGADRLLLRRISRAAAEQRAGRAGRLGPGRCYRLWTAEQHGSLAEHDEPQILGSDLTRLALELAQWGSTPDTLALLDQPPKVAWQHACQLLELLGAIGADGRITQHGRRMLALPLAPRLAHLLLQAQAAQLAGQAIWLVVSLEEGRPQADLVAQLQALASGSLPDRGLQQRLQHSARQMARQLGCELAGHIDHAALAVLLAWAFPERIARQRDGQPGVFQCADGGEARLHAQDDLAHAPWLAIAHWAPGPPRRILAAVAWREAEMLQTQGHSVTDAPVVSWDTRSNEVVCERQQRLGAIVLARKPLPEPPAELLVQALLAGVKRLGLECLPWNAAARQLQARVLSLRAWQAQDIWPDVSDSALMQTLPTWLAPWLAGMSRRAHLARLDLHAALLALLDYPQQQALQRLAPPTLTLASGHSVKLDYRSDGSAPLLSVRVQALYGSQHTPSVCNGQVAVQLQLLSPAQRPVAITCDLAGFWAGSYADVRKDMKGRYPKHDWPLDPAHAQPLQPRHRR